MCVELTEKWTGRKLIVSLFFPSSNAKQRARRGYNFPSIDSKSFKQINIWKFSFH